MIVANYISKTDLTLNLTLTTVLHIFTSNDASPYNGQDTLSHRPADKQIYNFKEKKVVAKTTYDRDRNCRDCAAKRAHGHRKSELA